MPGVRDETRAGHRRGPRAKQPGGERANCVRGPLPGRIGAPFSQLETLGFIGQGGKGVLCRQGQVPGGFIGEQAGPIGFSPPKRTFPLRNRAFVCRTR